MPTSGTELVKHTMSFSNLLKVFWTLFYLLWIFLDEIAAFLCFRTPNGYCCFISALYLCSSCLLLTWLFKLGSFRCFTHLLNMMPAATCSRFYSNSPHSLSSCCSRCCCCRRVVLLRRCKFRPQVSHTGSHRAGRTRRLFSIARQRDLSSIDRQLTNYVPSPPTPPHRLYQEL